MKRFTIESKERIKFTDVEKSEIESIIKGSDFHIDESDDLSYIVSTRENGSVGNGTSSDVDYKKGKDLSKLILSKLPQLSVTIERVDEWIILTIEKQVDIVKYRYVFKKDLNGAGFSETFFSMDDLIKKYGSWLKINWKDVRAKIDAIDTYPDSTFTGWMDAKPLTISRVGEPGNTWNYNFSIKKGKK